MTLLQQIEKETRIKASSMMATLGSSMIATPEEARQAYHNTPLVKSEEREAILRRWIYLASTYEQLNLVLPNCFLETSERIEVLTKMIPLADDPQKFGFLNFHICRENNSKLKDQLHLAVVVHYYPSAQDPIPPELLDLEFASDPACV